MLLAAWADAVGASETARRFVSARGDAPPGVWWPRVHARARAMWVLAEHLSRHGGRVEPAQLGRALLREGSQERPRSEVWAGGARPRVPSARSWTTTTPRVRSGGVQASSVVTTLPVGLVPEVDLEVIARRARRAAAIGAADPLALDLAAVQAVTVAIVVRSASEPIDPDVLVGQAIAEAWTPALDAALRLAPALARSEAHAQQFALQLNRYAEPVAATVTGLAAFLRHPDDPWEATLLALRVATDPAAAGAMAGALGGAQHGEGALPRPLEVPTRLRRAADALAKLAQPQ